MNLSQLKKFILTINLNSFVWFMQFDRTQKTGKFTIKHLVWILLKSDLIDFFSG